jgi:hypothetical protein
VALALEAGGADTSARRSSVRRRELRCSSTMVETSMQTVLQRGLLDSQQNRAVLKKN